LGELSLVEAAARLETVTLVPVELEPETALQIARENRRDWMNARAGLVDVWRQIELAANDLRSGLDVTFSGDLSTTDNNPVRFRGTTGRLRVGLEFDAPLTRLAERNAYREALIRYQQARRDYYTFRDRVSQSLRSTLRAMRLSQLNFELSRAAVRVAITQVELTRLRLQEPPKPGEASRFSPTTARDLVQALGSLLGAQNEFLGLWVDYEIQRMILDLDLGTMQLDPQGLWIDPGPVLAERSAGAHVPESGPSEPPEGMLYLEEIPPPEGLPVEELPPLPARASP
jgi:outer membrane protein TolC